MTASLRGILFYVSPSGSPELCVFRSAGNRFVDVRNSNSGSIAFSVLSKTWRLVVRVRSFRVSVSLAPSYAGHSSSRCVTVSWAKPHFVHVDVSVSWNRPRYALRGMCPVRSCVRIAVLVLLICRVRLR